MNTNFDIDALRAVVAGIDLGSFARAAAHLGRSQSAISMQLKKLEQQAGTQLFVRRGRGLVPTEAGETLAAHARRIIALNDEAAMALGAAATSATVRLGLPQDFFDCVMPVTLKRFAKQHPGVHVEVLAGPNHILSDEIHAGRLDGAIVLYPEGANEGELLFKLPMRWMVADPAPADLVSDPLSLVLYAHPCLFRQAALTALDGARRRWRVAVTTPSLPGVWGAVRSGLGVAVRTEHGMPAGIAVAGKDLGLPDLPPIELRLLRSRNASAAARGLCTLLRSETMRQVAPGGP